LKTGTLLLRKLIAQELSIRSASNEHQQKAKRIR